MELTDKTWEEILKEIILTHGQIGIMVVVAIIALIIGGVGVWVYLTKIKYKLIEYNLEKSKNNERALEVKLSEANKKIIQLEADNERLRNELKDINDYRHVRQAVKKDEKDSALQEFTKQ